MICRRLLACLLATYSLALHPRPEYKEYASFARWLVHESDYAVVSTHHNGSEVFGNVISVSDGNGYEDSTGLIYTFLPSLDATYEDLMADSRVALTFTEMALAGGTSGGCKSSTAESPPCGRLTISGRLTPVPKAHEATARKYLFARHPVMKGWDSAHMFRPFWLAKENISDFFLIDMYGGAIHPGVEEFFSAPWHRGSTGNAWLCSVCGHEYNPSRDGGGKPFEQLPDNWTCPVCGSAKSSYQRQALPDGSAKWIHA